MAKVKIILTEAPKHIEECPFCTDGKWNCILHPDGKCHCVKRDWTRPWASGEIDFSLCPYCKERNQ